MSRGGKKHSSRPAGRPVDEERGPLRRIAGAWDRFWWTPCPAHRIALFRILAPLAILGLMSTRLWNYDELFTRAGFHPPPVFDRLVQPVYFHPIGDDAALLVTLLLVASGVALSLGWRTRAANVIFAVLLGYASLFDRLSAVSVNKLGTVTMVALCFCPSGAAFSLDARRRRRNERARAAPAEIPGIVPRFLQVQVAVMYGASGICKAFRGDWLSHHDVLWSQIHDHYQTSFSYWAGRVLPAHAWPVLQWLVLAYELGAPLWLLWRRTRGPALVFGTAMHLAVGLMFRRIIYFSTLMISLLTLFWPDRAQLLVLRLGRRPGGEAVPSARRAREATGR